MPSRNLQHRRTHNLLLISKLLSQKEATSPFTLVIDSLEQSSKPLIHEVRRAAQSGTHDVCFVSFETLRKPTGVNVFIPAWKEAFSAVQRQISQFANSKAPSSQRRIVIIDSLNSLCSDPSISSNIPATLSSFLNPNTNLFAVYHADSPVNPDLSRSNPYSPYPLTLLRYLATTIFTTHSLHHILAQKAARDRSVAQPVFGLEAEIGGVLLSQQANGNEGTVLEMEHRRKSGRGVREWYFLPHPSQPSSNAKTQSHTLGKSNVILLEDHPLYRRPDAEADAEGAGEGDMDVTFSLGLTDRQRQDREGVVLPYFDAQKGGGEGGRILYDMGVEDDFDEEEDEI